MSREEAADRYTAALHAMQSGVAAWMGIDPSETTPKHLRVGVNSALSTCNALARLLIDKGVFTEDEYVEAVAAAMEREKVMQETRLTQHYGGPEIHLS